MKGPRKTLPKVFGQLRAKCFQHTAGREGSSAGWNFGGLWWWSILESRGWTESCHGSIQVVADFCLFLCNSSFLFRHVAYLWCFLNLCPSSAWAVSDLDVSQRPFRSLSRWLSLQEWHVYGVAPMAFYPRQPPLPWFECGEEKAMNLLEVGSWCQISSHPFTETCRTSSVFTLVPLFFSTFSTYNIQYPHMQS